MNKNPSLIFMGSPELATVILSALVQKQFNVLAVVSQPDKIAGRGQKLSPPPVAQFAAQHALKLLQPHSVKDTHFIEELKALKPDFLIVAAYGKILPNEILEIPKTESLNVHFSLLPKYRGASCVASAILNDEKETGVSIMRIVKALDAGPIFLQKKIAIENEDTTLSLETKLAHLGAEALVEVMESFQKQVPPQTIAQEDEKSSYAPLLKKEQGQIDWNLPKRKVYNQIRGLYPWPIAYTNLNGKKFKIFQSIELDHTFKSAKPGTLLSTENDYIEVACQDGSLGILEIQAESKKRMSFKEFKKGHPHEFKTGDVFI